MEKQVCEKQIEIHSQICWSHLAYQEIHIKIMYTLIRQFPFTLKSVKSVLKNPFWFELWFDRKSKPKMKIQMKCHQIISSWAIHGKQVRLKKVIKSRIHEQSNHYRCSLVRQKLIYNGLIIIIWWIPHWNGQQQKSVE